MPSNETTVRWYQIDADALIEAGDPQLVASVAGASLCIQGWGSLFYVLESYDDHLIGLPEIIAQRHSPQEALASCAQRVGDLLLSAPLPREGGAAAVEINATAVPDTEARVVETFKLSQSRVFTGPEGSALPADSLPFGAPWPEPWQEIVTALSDPLPSDGRWESLTDMQRRSFALAILETVGPLALEMMEALEEMGRLVATMPCRPEAGGLYALLHRIEALDAVAFACVREIPQLTEEIFGGDLSSF